MDKKALRLSIRQQKQAMTPEQIEQASARLCELFFETEQYKKAKTVYSYLPYNQEVRTVPILERAIADGKAVAVPKVYGDTMRFIYINSMAETAPGYSGIPEPIADGPIANDPTALVLMPGLAFDKEGHRIGYGGGFYDKFLAAEPHHPTVALCYGFQVLDRLETDDFDIPVDLVLWS
jgi:5-formyltetrahydrofolate cyclo-ligase